MSDILNKADEGSKSTAFIKKSFQNNLNQNKLASASLPIIRIEKERKKQSKWPLFSLDKIAVGMEFFFTALFLMEIVVKEIALLGKIGFFLGMGYAIVQTYTSCFNYYFDCFYKNKPLTKIQKNTFTIITIIFSLFSSISWFISSMAYGLVLYHFDFLHYSHANYLVFGLSLLAALVNTIGSIAHITYNVSKFKNTIDHKKLKQKLKRKNLALQTSKYPKEEKKTNTLISKFFIVTQKAGWFFRIINFGFLLSVSFHWYGFIMGAFLTIVDVYDNSVFLSSCDSTTNYKLKNKKAFYGFGVRYLCASFFTVCYTSYVVYLNLTYFASQYLTTPCWLNISYSVVTAACGACAGLIYRYKVFQKIKAKKNIQDEIEKFLEKNGITLKSG